MNDEMMNGEMMSGGMMWAMGLIWLLVIVLLVLSIAALVKYVFMGNKQQHKPSGSRKDALMPTIVQSESVAEKKRGNQA